MFDTLHIWLSEKSLQKSSLAVALLQTSFLIWSGGLHHCLLLRKSAVQISVMAENLLFPFFFTSENDLTSNLEIICICFRLRFWIIHIVGMKDPRYGSVRTGEQSMSHVDSSSTKALKNNVKLLYSMSCWIKIRAYWQVPIKNTNSVSVVNSFNQQVHF